MLIAIDHGNKQVKTVHGNAIVSGVQKSKTRPYGRDVLKYGAVTIRCQRSVSRTRRTKPQTSASSFCRCLPSRRKSKHRELIPPG